MMNHTRTTPLRRLGLCLCLAALSLHLSAQIPASWKDRWWEGLLEESMLPLNLTMQNALADWSKDNAESALTAIDALRVLAGVEGDSMLHEVYPVLYSPLQTEQSLQASSYSFNHDTLVFVQSAIGLKMTLVYDTADGSFSGTFRQGLNRANIRFTPCDTLSAFPRHQTPTPPYSFLAEQVTVSRTDREGRKVQLAGTLALPKGPVPKGGFPAVVLISGSGQQNRDEELFLHKPYLVWAEYLAQQGIASFR